MSQRIQLQQWINYLMTCQKNGTTPDDPPDELREAIERELKLLDDG